MILGEIKNDFGRICQNVKRKKKKLKKLKIENMSKKCFLNQNQFSNTKFELSEPSETPKHENNLLLTTWRCQNGLKT